MPNVKIYVDELLLLNCRAALVEALPALRAILCDALAVDIAACQFAIIPVLAMPDLPRMNVEIQIMKHPDRTREKLTEVARIVQAQTGLAAGTHAAVRIATLIPEEYVALK